MHLPRRSSAARQRHMKHSWSFATARRASAPSARCCATSLHKSRNSSRRRGSSAVRRPKASCAALRASAAACAARCASSRSARCCASSARRPSSSPRRRCNSPPRRLRAARASGASGQPSPSSFAASSVSAADRLLATGMVAAADAGPLALNVVNTGCSSQRASHSPDITVAARGPSTGTSPHGSCCASSRTLGSLPQSFPPFEPALSDDVLLMVRPSPGVADRATFGQSSRQSAATSRWRYWRNCA
mmetsp:Transcript_57216/g.183858  ORF Transcript_57216/g.183858 Transcript_57216/m.183858 type:complete len:247 (+) Transcript_57216:891-1631(+)